MVTGASTADDFNMLVNICDGDACLGVNADPSHCWEGEDWETRFLKVGPRIYAAHIKNFVVRRGLPLRAMEWTWPKRAMQFTDLGSGDLNMQRYAELLLHVGYQDRYCKLHGTESAPLVVEAESAAVVATRRSPTNDGPNVDRSLDGVSAVPPESEAVKLRAMIAS